MERRPLPALEGCPVDSLLSGTAAPEMGCAAIPAGTLHAYCFLTKSADAKSQAGASDWLSLGHMPALVAKEAGKVIWPF